MTCLKMLTSLFNVSEWLVCSNLLTPSLVQKHLSHESLAAKRSWWPMFTLAPTDAVRDAEKVTEGSWTQPWCNAAQHCCSMDADWLKSLS